MSPVRRRPEQFTDEILLVQSGTIQMTADRQLTLELSSLAHAGFEDYSVLWDGKQVGRIYNAKCSASGKLWFWGLAYRYHEGRTPTQGYETTCEAAMAAFARSWRRAFANRQYL